MASPAALSVRQPGPTASRRPRHDDIRWGRSVDDGLHEQARTPRCASGIALGSTRAELERSYATTIATTTIGVEFSAGGLQGVLASGAVQARITDLWAGTNCIAR